MSQKIIENYVENRGERALRNEHKKLENAKKEVEIGKTDLEKNILRLLIREQSSCCWSDDKNLSLRDADKLNYEDVIRLSQEKKLDSDSFIKKTTVMPVVVRKIFEEQGFKIPKTFTYYEAQKKLDGYSRKGLGIYTPSLDRLIFFPAHVPEIIAVMDTDHTMNYDLFRQGELIQYVVGSTVLKEVFGVEKEVITTPEQQEIQKLLQEAADTMFSSQSAQSSIQKIHEKTGEPIESIEATLRVLQDITMVTELTRLSNNPEYAYTFIHSMLGSQVAIHNKYHESFRYKNFSKKFMKDFIKKFGIIKPGELTTRELLAVSDFTVQAFETEVNTIFTNWKTNPLSVNKEFMSKYLVL